MQVTQSPVPDVLIIDPKVHRDDRGFFFESWNQAAFEEHTGLAAKFVQDNHSRSHAGVVRGIHYRFPSPQGKLVRCSLGAVWDVAVDLRRSSPTFAQWFGIELTAENSRQLWIPEGFGHGFVAMGNVAEVQYKTTAFFDAGSERVVAWNDPEVGIAWPVEGAPILSDKDANAPSLGDADVFD